MSYVWPHNITNFFNPCIFFSSYKTPFEVVESKAASTRHYQTANPHPKQKMCIKMYQANELV